MNMIHANDIKVFMSNIEMDASALQNEHIK
jgi:hypothetical protein